MQFKQFDQLGRMVQHDIGTPAVGIAAVEVTPAHRHRVQAGGGTGLDVAAVVADEQALRGRHAGAFAGQQHRCRIGLLHRQRIAGNHRAGALRPTDAGDQFVGEKSGLVGDDAPAQSMRLDPRKQLVDTVERARLLRQHVLVQLQVTRHHRFQCRLAAIGKRAAQHGTRTARDHFAHRRVRWRRRALFRALRQQCGVQIGSAVEQGAVQVEQHALDVFGQGLHAGFCALST